MKRIIICIFLAGYLIGCISEQGSFYDKPGKTDRVKNSIRIDGNYIGKVDHNGEKVFFILCLYSTGIALEYYLVMNNSSIDINRDTGKETILADMAYKDSIYKNVKVAGGFMINGKKVEIQLFEFGHYGKFELCTFSGDIINDSTIYISSCFMKLKSSSCPSNFYLYFQKMLKPDSSNQLMNKSWYWQN